MRLAKILPVGLAVSMANSIVYADDNITRFNDGRFALGGYGDVKYEEVDSADTSAFSARFIPIFLFSLNEKMHVEAETEISLSEEGETEIELEYADLHYFLTDTTTITAGKFLLPFGQFSANWHPSWINRTPWTPGIYGAHGSSQAMEPLLPILSDVGVAVQHTLFLSQKQKVFFDVYLTNGARVETEAHEEEEEAEDGHAEEEEAHEESLPEVEFESTNGDNNKDKAFGGRIAYAFLPAFEIGMSWYQASYDEEEALDIEARGVDINVIGDFYILRGEYIETETDGFEEEDGETEVHTFERNGWFLQGTLQLGQLWPSLGGTEFVLERAETNKYEEATRWAYGVNYWLDSRSVVKLAYEDTDLEEGDDQRLALQFSYGF